MAVLEALRGTHERILKLDAYDTVRNRWILFATDLLRWAESRIPNPLRSEYSEKSAELASVIAQEGNENEDGEVFGEKLSRIKDGATEDELV